MWTAEHHFQNHGFEVVPDVVLLNAVLAQRTQRIRFGSLVHVLTSWHPVRFAEDYALADVLSGGRLLCGVGRGTEPRESNPFGINVGWGGDREDVHNREVFEEQVAIFKAAIRQEEFSFHGTHYDLQTRRARVPGRAGDKPCAGAGPMTNPVHIYQAVRSEDTLRYAARERHLAVFWQTPRDRLGEIWSRYAQLIDQLHGQHLLDEFKLSVLELAQRILLISNPKIPAIQNPGRFIEVAEKLNMAENASSAEEGIYPTGPE